MARPRRTGRSLKKNIYIVSEGTVTEPEYLEQLRELYKNDTYNLKIQKHRKSGNNPARLLAKINEVIKNDFILGDHAFIIVDKDEWTEDHFNKLLAWSKKKGCYHLIVSNPSFEYWLLLHFEEGDGVNSRKKCDQKLEQYLPGFQKHLDLSLTRTMVEEATDRSKKRMRDKSVEDIIQNHDSNTNMHELVDCIFLFL